MARIGDKEREDQAEGRGRVASFGHNAEFEGDRLGAEDVLGEELVLVDYVLLKSTQFQDERSAAEGDKNEFAVLQVTRTEEDNALTVIVCGASAVVDAIRAIPGRDSLPLDLKIIKVKSKGSNRRYLKIE